MYGPQARSNRKRFRYNPSSSTSSSSSSQSDFKSSAMQRKTKWRKGLYGWGKSLAKKPTSYQETVNSGSITVANGAANSFGALTFGVSQYANFSDLAAIYDLYRITKVVVKFIPRGFMVSSSDGTGPVPVPTAAGPLHVVKDPDEAGVPTSIGDLLQYAQLKVARFGDPLTISFQPKAQLDAKVSTSTGTGMASQWTWMDSVNGNVLYYGVRFALSTPTNSTGANKSYYDIYTTIYSQWTCSK